MNRQEMEAELGLDLPDIFENYDPVIQELVIKYLKNLNSIERKAYTIGKSHLGSSFNIIKSNGFSDWKKNNK
jgi:hypothetical protein